MFNPGGMAIKMLKIAHNLCFLLIAESQSQLWQNTSVHLEDLTL